ncbi:molybdopterin molybdenumtransferase MoeA [Streptomyces sp. A0958]|uniref:molybdopterin molybdotransferase MoeA n=1 Tax=Streptomyces sp. A0958 TaxID=2563101 RepID=UPI00109EDDE4|nr:molybdopterin molybdotransferase MoeA [Streptomyces sp. A0958]THA72010.1 molybdopterin molybdenumtransferase MoeA [Streptomyces sp. A0958]
MTDPPSGRLTASDRPTGPSSGRPAASSRPTDSPTDRPSRRPATSAHDDRAPDSPTDRPSRRPATSAHDDRASAPTSTSAPDSPSPRYPASPQSAPRTDPQAAPRTSPRTAPRTSPPTDPRTAPRTSPPTDPRTSPPTDPRRREVSWGEARGVAVRVGRGIRARVEWPVLGHALGHVLAEPLVALTDLPSFDTSAMDGWAVAGPGPWNIRRDGGILAGHDAPAPLPDGDAVRIATGARIPAEVTAVIRSEHAHADEAKGLLYAQGHVSQGQDIRPRGQECRSGEHLLPAGTVVTPAVLGLAAAAGYDALPVRPRPRVDVLVLGDELLTEGLPHDGLIRDALGPMIGPWVRALGADVSAPRRLGDDAEALWQAITGSDADLIITTGGTAAGPVDHVHRVLARIGAELLVDGVAVRPGHPMLLARLAPGGPCLVGLPGNPLAAVSGLLTLAGPLLTGLAGRTPDDPYRVAVRDDMHGHPHDTRLVPVVHRSAGEPGTGGGQEHVVPLHYNGPAMLRGIAAADGLAVVEPGGVRSGTEVEILDLPWASATPWTEGCFT